MDNYWDKILQSVSDEFFIVRDQSYTVLNVICDAESSDATHLVKESISRDSLCQWAQDIGRDERPIGTRASPVLRCLLVSTHDNNDYPVDISRGDLSSVARSFGIASAHVPLLFAPFTGCATLDRQVSWYLGRPGLRAITYTNTKASCTNAIVTIAKIGQSDFEEDIAQLSSFARHPLMLAFAIRANTLTSIEKYFRMHLESLRHAEYLTDFGADYDESRGNSRQGPVSASVLTLPSPLPNFAKLSKKVGADASNLGNFKIILNKLEPIRKVLYGDGSSSMKWSEHFDGQLKQRYEQLSEDMLEMDTILEFKRKGLLESSTEYQNRARTLQSVMFNLIAKEDAEASIKLARESGLIATESRIIAQATRKDGNSMKTIAIMTMVFLPGTFYSSLFAVPTLQWSQSPVIQRDFWIYWAFTVPSTILVLLAWFIWNHIGFEEDLETHESARRAGKWWKRYSYHATKSNHQRIEKSASFPGHTSNLDIRGRHQARL